MKKKFFTLLAAAAFLVGAAVPASAQSASGISAGEKHTDALQQGKLYHIAKDAANYIYPDADNLLKLGTAETLAAGVWCVNAAKPVTSTYPEFSFENKAKGIALGVDLAPYIATGDTVYEAELTYSDVSSWRFSSTYQEGMDATVNYLMSYLPTTKDSVAVLTYDGAGQMFVEIVKAPAVGQLPTPLTNTLFEGFLFDAAPLVLTAEDFNTMFGSTTSTVAKGFNFIDPTSDQLEASQLKDKFVAEDVDLAGGSKYLRLADKADPTKYLRVDTTVYNVAGNPYLKFAYSKKAEYEALKTEASPLLELVEQHHFRLVYLPSADSMIINVENVYKPIKGDVLTGNGAWETWTYEGSDDVLADIAAGHNQVPAAGADDKTYVVVQNLTNTTYCLTIGETPVQTHIGFGFTGCNVSDNRTSLEGLFVIRNTEGKYLQVPIYTDTTTTNVAKWVTLEKNVDPFQMPSFQWAVEKSRLIDPENISMITLTNREYEGIKYGGIQLWSDDKTNILGGNVTATKGVSLDDKASFVEVPEAQRLDKYLGYKYVPADVAQVTTYTFNYLHELDATKYLSVKNDQNDSLLHVTDAKDAFELVPYHHSYTADNGWSVKPVDYGYQPTAWTTKKYSAQLVRSAYVLKIKEGNKIYNTNKVVVVDKEERYAVTSGDLEGNISQGDSAVFYLKTNNTKEGENFYALVDTASFTDFDFVQTGGLDRITVKAGVADHNMWVKAQNHYEIRTSAFSVIESESPLYRRFNREGAVKSDNFYSKDKAADLRDTLKFFRVNESNNFLYEDANSKYSKGLGINFLGQKHKSDFDATQRTIQMIVDTAYVARPAIAGALKETPKPQYLLWSTLRYVDGTESWDDEDECHCEPPVVTDPYSIGRLLINATDSTKLDKVGKNYMWDNQWERLIFTWAVRNAENPDILYIINPTEFVKVSPFSYKALEASKAVVRKIDLGNNSHKDVAFSFRLYENEDAIDYAEQIQNFFIESESGARENGKQINDRNSNGVTIAPMVGGWVKIHNGVPVISRGAFDEKKISDAERFNVEVDNSGDTPVANEDVNAANGVKVTAEAGVVRIQNGADKSVTISNILGQTIASQIITSDDVTIAAPKGIVVVAVQGEDAVKAIVK
ncbi:DUF6383 domain-containing protein [Massilibacteroides vaginae]|uniref:DUF6383 domain-containing protein n=1 Tax=Massilibacteroides vaginae TaxID=1673718 RepID=UPI000A1CAE03|nr:DUF6383 domain-containing protein [Massilibacteroides vaginae]